MTKQMSNEYTKLVVGETF